MKLKDIAKVTGLPVLFASLCCVSPIVIFLLGLGSVTFVGSLSDTLYGDYKWYFRLAGFLLLVASLVFYFRKKGICSVSKAKRHRNEIINTVLITLAVAVSGYIFWLYVVVHYLGVWLKIWS